MPLLCPGDFRCTAEGAHGIVTERLFGSAFVALRPRASEGTGWHSTSASPSGDAHGNAARHVADDLNAEGEWAAQPVNRPLQPPARQLLSPADALMTPARAPAAAADRTQRPDATCEERVTVQGPVKKQQPDGMSHGGGGGGWLGPQTNPPSQKHWPDPEHWSCAVLEFVDSRRMCTEGVPPAARHAFWAKGGGGNHALEGGEVPPRPLQGAQPTRSHCPPDGKGQPQWHL